MSTNQLLEPFDPAKHSLVVHIAYGPHEENPCPAPHWFLGGRESTHQELLVNNTELIAWGVAGRDAFPIRERVHANGGRIQYGYCPTEHVLLAFEGDPTDYFVETQEQ